jgi:hypothetical protein
MLGPRDQVDARIGRQSKVGLAFGVDVDQRGALLPVLRRGIGRDQQGIAAVAAKQRTGAPARGVGPIDGAEREPVFGIETVLMLGRRASRLGESSVGEHLPGACGVGKRAVEHAAAAFVLVHSELDEAADEAAALGNAEAERMARPGGLAAPAHRRVRGALGIGAVVAQKRHQVPGGGEADADHLRRRRVVPQFIDRDRLELPPGGRAGGAPPGWSRSSSRCPEFRFGRRFPGHGKSAEPSTYRA